VEISVTIGIWAMGMFVMTVLIKVAVPIEQGELRMPEAPKSKSKAARAASAPSRSKVSKESSAIICWRTRKC
jgi:hypothetical protein